MATIPMDLLRIIREWGGIIFIGIALIFAILKLGAPGTGLGLSMRTFFGADGRFCRCLRLIRTAFDWFWNGNSVMVLDLKIAPFLECHIAPFFLYVLFIQCFPFLYNHLKLPLWVFVPIFLYFD